MLPRFSTSRRTRSTEKLVDGETPSSDSPVWMSMAPSEYLPARPVTRPPARIGTGRLPFRPMRRLKNTTGVSPGPWLPPVRAPGVTRVDTPPNWKMPCPSRKNSRFSGKKTLKRVRFTCCSSSSTCAKSVLYEKSAVRLFVSPTFRSPPMSPPGSLFRLGVPTLSVRMAPVTYGFSSSVRDDTPGSTPTRVANDDAL